VNAYQHQYKNEGFIDVLQPGVTVLNRQSVKGQEFDTVFILEFENFVPCMDDAMRRVMYMMCARARDFLMFVYGPGELSPAAAEALPPPHLLERA
jgi:superfamily I DNA/RNA helicase